MPVDQAGGREHHPPAGVVEGEVLHHARRDLGRWRQEAPCAGLGRETLEEGADELGVGRPRQTQPYAQSVAEVVRAGEHGARVDQARGCLATTHASSVGRSSARSGGLCRICVGTGEN